MMAEMDFYRKLVMYVFDKTKNGWKDSGSERYSFWPRFDIK